MTWNFMTPQFNNKARNDDNISFLFKPQIVWEADKGNVCRTTFDSITLHYNWIPLYFILLIFKILNCL